MEMSPQQVRNASFKTSRKGYDPDEVTGFLRDVAEALEAAQNQSTAMEARARAAVARLQELSAKAEAEAPAEPQVAPDQAEQISRTLLLAQRTADATIAEANAEAERILAAARDEAATTIDSTREMSAVLLDEARAEARRLSSEERERAESEVQALLARRDFLEADVDHLERFLVDQRERLREAATSLVDLAERVPGGLGHVHRPVLSAATGSSPALDDTVAMPRVAVPDEHDTSDTSDTTGAQDTADTTDPAGAQGAADTTDPTGTAATAHEPPTVAIANAELAVLGQPPVHPREVLAEEPAELPGDDATPASEEHQLRFGSGSI